MAAYKRENLDPIAQPLICRMFSSLNVKLFCFGIKDRNLRITFVESFTSRNLATASMPSLCDILMYKDAMSFMTKKAPFAKGSILSSLLIKSVVSLIYDFNFCPIG